MEKLLIDLNIGDKIYRVVDDSADFSIEECIISDIVSGEKIKTFYVNGKNGFTINLVNYPSLKDSLSIRPGQGSYYFYSTSEEKAAEYIICICRQLYRSCLISAKENLDMANKYHKQIEKFGGKP